MRELCAPDGQGCWLWTWKLGNWTQIESLNRQYHNIKRDGKDDWKTGSLGKYSKQSIHAAEGLGFEVLGSEGPLFHSTLVLIQARVNM